jgi:hypothetical protein
VVKGSRKLTVSSIACATEADTGVLLLRNTQWTRTLYSQIRSMLESQSAIDKVVVLS